ncbi:hypothetical protein N658DRAFT_78023 [Parathielavia hyrcaniae]|uniref:Uncharacterized protein n=1 Tax=Parathielavia hyrcaniae TaxID=113614 RepID=A0AAN6T1Q1_9PEZI|nr:hypothetical protein N658DRAFT_78023 [Parathielavia hyrcaniae]
MFLLVASGRTHPDQRLGYQHLARAAASKTSNSTHLPVARLFSDSVSDRSDTRKVIATRKNRPIQFVIPTQAVSQSPPKSALVQPCPGADLFLNLRPVVQGLATQVHPTASRHIRQIFCFGFDCCWIRQFVWMNGVLQFQQLFLDNARIALGDHFIFSIISWRPLKGTRE